MIEKKEETKEKNVAKLTLALIAHDAKKGEMANLAATHAERLATLDLVATRSTGQIVREKTGLPVNLMLSGPLGGDQQIGARIAEGDIDFPIFFWDPLAPLPHDPDVKALLRVAVVCNIPFACNRASADFLISSPLMSEEYDRILPDYDGYRGRLDR